MGAAAVHVGVLGLGTAFAFATGSQGTTLWDAGPGRAGSVGGLDGTAEVRRRGARLRLGPTKLELDVPVDGGRLHASIDMAAPAPVTLLTPTAHGGWNATTKAAGQAATGHVSGPAGTWDLDGGAWTDATDGRQDSHTTWRWAAGAGRSEDGRRVGLQASTGMNAHGPGEDLVWWDDQPVPLDVRRLEPVERDVFDGTWRCGGESWELLLEPTGVRAADEGIGPIRSSYTQPIGTWRGTLPSPAGTPVPVWLTGVAEDHEARW